MRDQVEFLFDGVTQEVDGAAVLALHDRIRSAIEHAAAIAPEAARERSSHLTDAPDPDPLVRTMRRISHDLVMIARALPAPFPEPIGSRLAEPTRHAAAEIAAFFAEAGTALARRTEPPPLEAVADAVTECDSTIAELRRDRVIVTLSAGDAERIFGFAFALQQMRRNMEELAGRAAEMARKPRGG